MTTKQKRILFGSVAVLLWLALWEILSHVVGVYFIFPSFTQTVSAFCSLCITGNFYLTVILSLLRIALGFVIGTFSGIALGALSHLSLVAYSFIHPIISVIRSTPVASIIIILWFFISKDFIPIVIGLFMVSPIIWQATYDSLHVKNRELTEIADIFGLKGKKRISVLILPTFTKYLLPAVVTSSALAWKSGIAAEIITYTKNSIGYEIANAKNILEGADMFAWTITVILLSAFIEMLIKFTVRRLQAKWV